MAAMEPTESGQTWVGLYAEELPIARAYEWAVQPQCGAVVLFSGTVRDHAPGRPGVIEIVYEAYEEQLEARLRSIDDELRARWPEVGRVVLLHRIGRLVVGESSVVTVVSAPHRDEAFAAGRFAIDALKAVAPIWKNETWEGGQDWGLAATAVGEASSVRSAPDRSED